MEQMYEALVQECMDAIPDEQCKKLCETAGIDPTDPGAKRFFAISLLHGIMGAMFGL